MPDDDAFGNDLFLFGQVLDFLTWLLTSSMITDLRLNRFWRLFKTTSVRKLILRNSQNYLSRIFLWNWWCFYLPQTNPGILASLELTGKTFIHEYPDRVWRPESGLNFKNKSFKYKTYFSCQTFKDCYAMALSTIALIKKEQEIRFR